MVARSVAAGALLGVDDLGVQAFGDRIGDAMRKQVRTFGKCVAMSLADRRAMWRMPLKPGWSTIHG
jgi:hypothetical protein